MNYRRKHINPKIRNLRPKKRVYKSPVFWAMVLALVIIISFFYLVFFWSKFQIQSIQVSGNVKVQIQEIEDVVTENIYKKLLWLSHKSIFIADTQKITSDILQKFPAIEKVYVKKKYPDSLMVKITERNQFAVFCTQPSEKNCFSIDKSGIVFEAVKSREKNILLLTSDQDNKEVFTGENVIQKNVIDTISKIQAELKNNFQIDIQEAFVSNPLILRTSENWKLYFDPEGDIQSQITKMNALLKDQITPTARKNLEYIYLQYKDRAYYK